MPRTQRDRIRTKIVATLGPASADDEVIERLLTDGVGAFRLNFSHGSLEEHQAALDRVRRVTQRLGVAAAIIGDLCGPKIRIDPLADEPLEIDAGDELIIQREPADGRDRRVSTNYEQFVDEVAIGQRVLIDDGMIRLVVESTAEHEVRCRCLTGGPIHSRKGVNLPDSELSVSAITAFDRQCLTWAIRAGVDYLALSFVRRGSEMRDLRQIVDEAGGEETHLIAKIEKPEAVRAIDGIIDASDAIMVARGDLGVEMDLAEVPIIQKDIIARCRKAAKPVIVATQMLQSMIDSATPTRAEVSDVANAIFDRTDALMLSGETAIGRYPRRAVAIMGHTAELIGRYQREQVLPNGLPAMPELDSRAQDAALARGAWQMAHHMDVKLVVLFSRGGTNARVFSKLRLRVPVVAITESRRTAQRMALYYGVVPLRMPISMDVEAVLRDVDRALLDEALAEAGDTVLIVGSLDPSRRMHSDTVMVHRVLDTGPHD